jgi:hypothetical protein
MKIYLCILSIAAMMFFASCGDTTNQKDGNRDQYNAADSSVGNSEAANTIYRDSANIRHATESSGGTGNPSNKNPSSKERENLDSIQK